MDESNECSPALLLRNVGAGGLAGLVSGALVGEATSRLLPTHRWYTSAPALVSAGAMVGVAIGVYAGFIRTFNEIEEVAQRDAKYNALVGTDRIAQSSRLRSSPE